MAHLEHVRFHSCLNANAGGCWFLGYVSATLVAPKALPDGSDMMITIRDIELALNASGEPVIGFKSKKVEREGRETAYFPYAFSRNAETRAWLTATLFALPEVQRVVDAADRFDREGCNDCNAS